MLSMFFDHEMTEPSYYDVRVKHVFFSLKLILMKRLQFTFIYVPF